MSYELLSMLPEGATSRTWLAVRNGADRVVLREVAEGTSVFLAEATPRAVLSMLEVSEVRGRQYAVYPWVPGVTLAEVLDALRETDAPVPLGLVARVVLDAARAVGRLHAMTPPLPPHDGLADATMLIGAGGQVFVLDYGAPRPSRFAATLGGRSHSDVFALAAVLHSALTDFAGAYGDAVDDAVPLPPPSQLHPEAPRTLDEVLARALSRGFARRQVDAVALADELEAALEGKLFSRAQVAEAVGALFPGRLAEAPLLMGEGADDAPRDEEATAVHPAPWRLAEQLGPRDAALEPKPKGPAVPWVTGMTVDEMPAPGLPNQMSRIALETVAERPPQPIEPGTVPERAGPFMSPPLGGEGDDPLAGTAPFRAQSAVGAADTQEDLRDAVKPLAPAPAPEVDEVLEAPPAGEAPTETLEDAADGMESVSTVLTPTGETDGPAPEALADALEGDTRPRARAPEAPPIAEESTRPRAPMPRPSHPTSRERALARGQERIATPPLGVPEVDGPGPSEEEGLDITEQPTNLRLAPVPEVAPKRGRAVLAVGLLVLLVGLGAVALGAPQLVQSLRARLGLAGAPSVEAPNEADVDDGLPEAATVVADGAADGGGDGADDVGTAAVPAMGAEAEDAGAEALDASTDAGAGETEAADAGLGVDAGVSAGGEAAAGDEAVIDAGQAAPAPARHKKSVKRKKRRRRW